MSVRKAHNSGKNHLRNVVDYYQRMFSSTSFSFSIRVRTNPTNFPFLIPRIQTKPTNQPTNALRNRSRKSSISHRLHHLLLRRRRSSRRKPHASPTPRPRPALPSTPFRLPRYFSFHIPSYPTPSKSTNHPQAASPHLPSAVSLAVLLPQPVLDFLQVRSPISSHNPFLIRSNSTQCPPPAAACPSPSHLPMAPAPTASPLSQTACHSLLQAAFLHSHQLDFLHRRRA